MSETSVMQEKHPRKAKKCEECGGRMGERDGDTVCLSCGLVAKRLGVPQFIPAGEEVDPAGLWRKPGHKLPFDKGKGTETNKSVSNKLMNAAHGGRFNLSDDPRERISYERAQKQINRLMSAREYPNEHTARELLSKHNRAVLKLTTPVLGHLTDEVLKAVDSIAPRPRKSIKAIINGVLCAYGYPEETWIGIDAGDDEEKQEEVV